MQKILFITKDKYNFSGLDVVFQEEYQEPDFMPDVILLDMDVKNSASLLVNLAASNYNVIYLADEKLINNLISKGLKVFQKPVSENILKNEINLILENKKKLERLHLENMELKKNLYQIDAFYNASSKFAGTLDKNKLYEVMFETFERVLSYDAACALFKDSIYEDKNKFYIYSLKKTTSELNDSLIKRLSFAAKNEGINLKAAKTEIIHSTKPSYKNEFYDFSLTAFDTLFAPVVIKDKFQGVVEIFRKNPFTKEDVACFQSIIHQVLAPLRSAILYEEIMNTNEKLKKLERIKSEFVSIVSHELRTPLTPINNALSIILSEQAGKIGETNKNFANIAKRNISRLSGIIEDLLDLSRMQTGKFDFKFVKSEIYPSIELAFDTFKNQAAAKEIDFILDVEKKLPPVYADLHRIDQILSNLINNALKFTPKKGKIVLSTEIVQNIDKTKLIAPIENEYKGRYVKISISDTGIGIEKEDIPKIFDKFSQIENSLSRNTGGIGLGLAITKHFIDAHLGGIWVNSEKNEGSVFNVIIPEYSQTTAFEADLRLKIFAKHNIAYFEIQEPEDTNFFDKIKKENILKYTKESEEITQIIDGKKISRAFITGIDKTAYDFMASKIEDEIKNCDIVLNKGYYKKENS